MCVIEVEGLEGKFSKNAMPVATPPCAPVVGDKLVLHPGPSWGVVECVVSRRIVSEDGLRLVAALEVT